MPILDLREVCSEPEAFANDIEPSEVGGDLIADAILAEVMPELPRLIIVLDDGEELVCENNQLERRQDVYNRKKVAEIGLSMRQSPHVNPVVIEITNSATYNGGIIIKDKTNIVIRAKAGEAPVIDCSVLGRGVTCLLLDSTADRNVKNIGIKGLAFKDIRRRGFGGDAPPANATRPASGGGIASFNGKILENIVIEDNVFDNFDATKDETFKGEAIHLNEVDGLLIRRNTIRNGGAHGFASADENGAITIHEFILCLSAQGGRETTSLTMYLFKTTRSCLIIMRSRTLLVHKREELY